VDMKCKGLTSLVMHLFSLSAALATRPGEAIRNAGYDVDSATSWPARRVSYGLDDQAALKIDYAFGDFTVSLFLDPDTSETIRLFESYGRGPHPTGDTASLSSEWASTTLMLMNPYRIARGLVRLGEPSIEYLPSSAKYLISFQRLDSGGHVFEDPAAVFQFDAGTSRVTSLHVYAFLPEPSVTTGTLLTELQATSAALSGLMANRGRVFEHVPEKMDFVYEPSGIVLGVVGRNDFFGGGASGTAVAYRVSKFRSRLTDPAYRGVYEEATVVVDVDAFDGSLVGGYASIMVLFNE